MDLFFFPSNKSLMYMSERAFSVQGDKLRLPDSVKLTNKLKGT